jgi:hypothetical protein
MEKKSLNVVCAWCGGTIQSGTGERTSHGICAACVAKEAAAIASLPAKKRKRKNRPRP